jgi:hypothetical protein
MTIAARTLILVALALVSCASPAKRLLHGEPSGFLDDYSKLERAGAAPNLLVYRNPDARWPEYDKVLLEPVTLWRSGRKSLEPVPAGDLARLVVDFDLAVRRRLGDGFTLVSKPGPGVMRIRLAVTSAHATDKVLDILSLEGRANLVTTSGDGPLHPEMLGFLEEASIEGEILDAQTNAVLAQGVEHRRRVGGMPLDTWAQVDRALDAWAERVVGQMERRAAGKP